MKYPRQIVVFIENAGQEDEWFDVSEDAAKQGESRKVGLYELKEVVTLTTEVKVSKSK